MSDNDNNQASDNPSVVEVENASKRFGATQALRDVSLAVKKGEIHALVGRNGAGKSTLVGVLTGITELDSGTIFFDGVKAPENIAEHPELVSCLYQHSMLIPEMSVAENLFINRFNASGPSTFSHKALNTEADAILTEWQVHVDPRALVRNISTAERQMVEIARALSQGSSLIILDEPTAQLDGAQVDQLFAAITHSRERGASFLYISHFLSEIFRICDTATVLREGENQLHAPVSSLTEADLIDAMVGPEDSAAPAGERGAAPPERMRRPGTGGETVMQIEGLALDGQFESFDLEVRRGEILGIAGGARSGGTEIGELLAGLHRPSAGAVRIEDEPVPLGRVQDAIDAGIGYVPHDRQVNGFIPEMSVAENLAMTASDDLGSFGFISPRKRGALADELIERFSVVTAGRDTEVKRLSGGNQQKVVLGRAVAPKPRVVVVDAPTAGVDISAANAILESLREMAEEGAVILISNLIPELRACDRVQVIFDGTMTHELSDGWAENELIAAIEGVG